jgi:hypothetical protein
LVPKPPVRYGFTNVISRSYFVCRVAARKCCPDDPDNKQDSLEPSRQRIVDESSERKAAQRALRSSRVIGIGIGLSG